MKKLLLIGALLLTAVSSVPAASVSVTFSDEPRWRHRHHRYYTTDSSYYCYDCPRDYYRSRYYYRGGYWYHGVWVPRVRIYIH